MALTKYNLVRIKRLLAMLKENRYPNYSRFVAEMKRQDPAGTYQLSSRTLQRDIEYLKVQYNAPIRYDFTQKGYYLTVPDWSIDIPFLEDNEMQAAVLGARLAENIMPAPLNREIRTAVDSLLSVNEKGMDENATLLSLVAMGSRVAARPEIFQSVFECWQKHLCMELTYDSVTGKQSTHLMEPHVLAFYEGNWYTKGLSRSKNGVEIPPNGNRLHIFALHRIVSVKKTGLTFVPDKNLVEQANRRQLFVFPEAHDVRLRVSREAIKFLAEQFEFTDEGTEGEYRIVEIGSAPVYKIVNFVLVESGEAKLLNHPEIQEEVIKRAKRCIAVLEGK